MRRFAGILALFTGALVAGLLLASLLLRQECPECSGTSRYFRENPLLCEEGPVLLDCPRCADRGQVSLLSGSLGRSPDPLMADLMRRSHRNFWKSGSIRDDLALRLRGSGLKTAGGREWLEDSWLLFGRARFLRQAGKDYVLLVLDEIRYNPDRHSTPIFLFEASGTLVDVLRVTSIGGPSSPLAKFVVPVEGDGRCAILRLLTWKGKSFEEIEIDHAGKVWRGGSGGATEKLGLLEWDLRLRDGKLRISGGGQGISVVD